VGWAFAVSLAIHGVALAAILWGWGTSSLPEGVPVMDVELVIASPGESGAGKSGPDAPPATEPPAPPQTDAPDPSVKTEVATTRDSEAGEIPILLPPPDPPPPVQAEDLGLQPAEPSSATATPPRAPARSPNAKSAPPPPRPGSPPAPKPSPQVAAPARPDKAPTTPPGSGVADDPTAGSAATGGGARLMRHVAPVYPALARERGVEGRVVVRLLVGADGVPAEVRVAQSSGFESLDAAALVAVRQWRFEPARRGGVAVAEERLAPVVFRLRR
jgi:protein TonB